VPWIHYAVFEGKNQNDGLGSILLTNGCVSLSHQKWKVKFGGKRQLSPSPRLSPSCRMFAQDPQTLPMPGLCLELTHKEFSGNWKMLNSKVYCVNEQSNSEIVRTGGHRWTERKPQDHIGCNMGGWGLTKLSSKSGHESWSQILS
jgi:hypothetical protein